MGTVSTFSSKCYPGRSTYGGDTQSGTVRAFGSVNDPGQRDECQTVEHSVLEMALDSGLTEGISHLEPLEHSVLNVALDDGPVETVGTFGS